jgi:hypothetical protein
VWFISRRVLLGVDGMDGMDMLAQLTQAGLRLAKMLNGIYDPSAAMQVSGTAALNEFEVHELNLPRGGGAPK